jgi:type IV secretion system protein VirB5
MKRILSIAAMVICFSCSSIGYAQIPVIDGTAIGQLVEQLKQMKEQLDVMQKQYAKLEDTYNLMKGNRGLGAIHYDTKNDDYVDVKYQDQYDTIRDDPSSGINSSELQNAKIDTDSICKNLGPDQMSACQRQLALAGKDKGLTNKAFEMAENRLTQLRQLLNAISSTTDQKGILELSARIQAEQAIIQNEAIKVQLYKMASDNERRLAEIHAHSANTKKMNYGTNDKSIKGGIDFSTISNK